MGNAESPFSHVLAASAGEFFACLIRVPTENVKQLAQAGVNGGSSMKCAKFVLESEGAKGLFRGFFTTLARDVPFSVIQFPVYELLKNWAGENASPGALAICGAIAGSIGGALTSPTDVAKTRLMLRVDRHGVKYDGMLNTILRVYREEGMRALFSGAGTRIVWISLGGFVFFGTYEWAQESLTKHQIGG